MAPMHSALEVGGLSGARFIRKTRYPLCRRPGGCRSLSDT